MFNGSMNGTLNGTGGAPTPFSANGSIVRPNSVVHASPFGPGAASPPTSPPPRMSDQSPPPDEGKMSVSIDFGGSFAGGGCSFISVGMLTGVFHRYYILGCREFIFFSLSMAAFNMPWVLTAQFNLSVRLGIWVLSYCRWTGAANLKLARVFRNPSEGE